ncbi:hypothetical protein C8Q77DRAFT_1125678 [Trametes polyzona]|nr:hypothetical protein C8Q77DRAFT_1125678 [Trametes polyzona]
MRPSSSVVNVVLFCCFLTVLLSLLSLGALRSLPLLLSLFVLFSTGSRSASHRRGTNGRCRRHWQRPRDVDPGTCLFILSPRHGFPLKEKLSFGHVLTVPLQVELDTNDAMDVDSEEPEQAPAFASYHSLLDYHPLLRERSRHEPAPKLLPASPSSVAPRSIDLGPLKEMAVQKYLSSGSGRICQYEVPGGGECRDKNCEDVHLSRISLVEPSDEDTAQYLCTSLPAGPRYGVKAFRDALDVARLRHPTMPFDERVQEAVAALGLR